MRPRLHDACGYDRPRLAVESWRFGLVSRARGSGSITGLTRSRGLPPAIFMIMRRGQRVKRFGYRTAGLWWFPIWMRARWVYAIFDAWEVRMKARWVFEICWIEWRHWKIVKKQISLFLCSFWSIFNAKLKENYHNFGRNYSIFISDETNLCISSLKNILSNCESILL